MSESGISTYLPYRIDPDRRSAGLLPCKCPIGPGHKAKPCTPGLSLARIIALRYYAKVP